MIDISCIENVIGLTLKKCPCYPDTPQDWQQCNNSLSGFYVDNEYMVQLQGDVYDACKEGNIYDKLKESREEGLKRLYRELIIAISTYQTLSFGNVNCDIGAIKAANSIFNKPINCDRVGIELSPKKVLGTQVIINKIAICIDDVGVYDVGIYVDDVLVQTVQVNGGNGSIQWVNVGEVIRLNGQKKIKIEYARNGGIPYNNEVYCPTCTQGKPHYWNMIEVRGVCGDKRDNHTYGILANISYQCNYLDWLCSVPSDFWCSHPWGLQFAKLAEIAAALQFNNWIVNNGKIDFYTLVKKEAIWGANKRLTKILNEGIQVLACDLPDSVSDCFTCESKYKEHYQITTHYIP